MDLLLDVLQAMPQKYEINFITTRKSKKILQDERKR